MSCAQQWRTRTPTTRARTPAGAATEVIRWAEEIGTDEHPNDFALALSALPAGAIEVWWQNYDGAGFTQTFRLFADALEHLFRLPGLRSTRDFARRAVEVTRDQVILGKDIRGLAALGCNHNRWHVRDVTVGILQSMRDDDDAVSGLEGLRMAGGRATEGRPALRSPHPAPDPAGRNSTHPGQPRLRAGAGHWGPASTVRGQADGRPSKAGNGRLTVPRGRPWLAEQSHCCSPPVPERPLRLLSTCPLRGCR